MMRLFRSPVHLHRWLDCARASGRAPWRYFRLASAVMSVGLIGSCRCPELPDELIERAYTVTANEVPEMQGAIVTVTDGQVIVEYDRPNGHSYRVIWNVVGKEQL